MTKYVMTFVAVFGVTEEEWFGGEAEHLDEYRHQHAELEVGRIDSELLHGVLVACYVHVGQNVSIGNRDKIFD